MEIKEVKLNSELQRVKDFLLSCDLNYEEGIDKTLYIEEDSNILASISKEQSTIKCLAVDKKARSDNYASKLVSEMINLMYQEGIYHILVYTKAVYSNLFQSLGFKLIVQTNLTAILEQGTSDITKTLKDIRFKVESKFDIDITKEKINAVVLNANPFTEGHLHLVEEAIKTCNYLIVFLLEEDKSYYTFKERMTLAYVSLQCHSNVIVLPSSKYIVSSLTFPTYFIKERNVRNHEWMATDALIFRDYFMKELNIKYRYVGVETDEVMKLYNQTLKEYLGEKLIEIKRLASISASAVRDLVKNGKIDEALRYIPQASKQVFRLMQQEKNNE